MSFFLRIIDSYRSYVSQSQDALMLIFLVDSSQLQMPV